jgi:tetratricopeptide (TPR) repeat protein
MNADAPNPFKLSMVLTGLAIFGAIWANGFLFARFWPNASAFVEIWIAVALAMGIMLLYWWRVPRNPSSKKRSWWRVVDYSAGVVVFALETHSRYHSPRQTASPDSGWKWFLIVPGAFLVIVLAYIAPALILTATFHKAYARGDHRGAMRMMDQFGRFVRQSLRDDCRSLLLLYAGEAKQAELLIRSVLENPSHSVLKNELSLTLGQALMDQGRQGEAAAIFEQVIEGSPKRMGGYDGLAEVRILEGRASEALDLIDRALQAEAARPSLVRRFEGYSQGHLWANRAWAEAAVGWRAQAEQALQRAFEASGNHKPERAGVHYRAGMMWSVLGSPAKAGEHFRAARELDPEGRYGKKGAPGQLVTIS